MRKKKQSQENWMKQFDRVTIDHYRDDGREYNADDDYEAIDDCHQVKMSINYNNNYENNNNI